MNDEHSREQCTCPDHGRGIEAFLRVWLPESWKDWLESRSERAFFHKPGPIEQWANEHQGFVAVCIWAIALALGIIAWLRG